MGRSQETSNKKTVRSNKEKKRKDKELKRAKKKVEGKTRNFDDMIAYVNEFGMITSTPPDANRKTEVDAESIEVSVTRNKVTADIDKTSKGVVTTFNNSKGYGFIRDLATNKSIFVHVNNLIDRVSENDIVVFEVVRGPKGDSAVQVRLFTE